jgi:uroporphyrin-III C-methyltransferase
MAEHSRTTEQARGTEHTGRVVLVGAGPGDPDLLTVGGARALGRADVVVHDRLVSEAVLALARPSADLIGVGKRKGGGCPQEVINDLLIGHARAGRFVVRLKGGDPFLFGRGGEECDALERHGIPCEVIPGISAAFAAPASAGVPVTHRGLSNAVTVISGHVLGEYDWCALSRVPGSLVVMMAATTAAGVAAELIAHGRPLDQPVAIIHAATTPAQRTAFMTLDELRREGCPLPSPSVLVIGDVATRGTMNPSRLSCFVGAA